MKTRTGFVSNSSSSSIVVIGIKVDDDTFKKMGGYEFFEKKFGYVDHIEGQDYSIVGSRLGRWSSGEGDVNELSIAEFDNERTEVAKAIAEIFPGKELSPSLIFGESYG